MKHTVAYLLTKSLLFPSLRSAGDRKRILKNEEKNLRKLSFN